jgi:acrylyl-CoA reductase (NADPH)
MAHRAVVVSKEGKKAQRTLVRFDDFSELPYQNPECDVTVRVTYSTINFKDGIVLTAGAGVALKFPIVSGIDFAGTVVEDTSGTFAPGQRVVLTGHYNGQHMDGGHADLVRTRSDWLVPLPEYLSDRQAMIVGTAGFTAMMCVMALEKHGNLKRGEAAPVLVTGAAGGVGSFATAILTHLGYNVVGSVYPKTEETEAHCKRLGCKNVIEKLEKSKPLGKEVYAGCVETVGGVSLATSLASMKYGGAVSSCGLAGSSDLPGSVMPFILRGVKLLGIDSVQAPMEIRREVWAELGRIGLPKAILEQVVTEYSLDDVAGNLGPLIMAGKLQGRALIDMAKQPAARLSARRDARQPSSDFLAPTIVCAKL